MRSNHHCYHFSFLLTISSMKDSLSIFIEIVIIRTPIIPTPTRHRYRLSLSLSILKVLKLCFYFHFKKQVLFGASKCESIRFFEFKPIVLQTVCLSVARAYVTQSHGNNRNTIKIIIIKNHLTHKWLIIFLISIISQFLWKKLLLCMFPS